MQTKLIQTIILIFSLLFLGNSPVMGQDGKKTKHKLFSQKANLKKVAADFKFTEGPTADAEGNIYFTDQPNDRILKWTHKDNQVRTFMEKAGRSNGLYVDESGNIIACADANNELWQIDENKKVKVLIKDYQGKKLNGPNDLWITPEGGLYFSDPFYKRPYWTRSEKEIEEERLYYLSPEGKLEIAATGFDRPNGLIGTADGKILYVADIKAGKTYRFEIGPNGKLSNRSLFAELGSDGMTMDKKGNVYLTGKGVTVFNPQGEKIAHIPVEENWTANVTFGGKKGKTLFITAMGAVYTLDMKVKGNAF